MGRPAEPEPSLTLHSLLLPVFLAEFTKFSRRRRPCCSRGTQLALLALVTTALWAGLLTLLLLQVRPNHTGIVLAWTTLSSDPK